jgi:hypothetical protein
MHSVVAATHQSRGQFAQIRIVAVAECDAIPSLMSCRAGGHQWASLAQR